MRKFILSIFLLSGVALFAAPELVNDSLELSEVVVTGSRSAVDARFLPLTVSVVDREQLTSTFQSNVLSTLSEQVPSLFVTSRAMMGYGVSGGAAGGINMRGLSGGAGQMMVLIDGHPQYQGIFGHTIADSYQSMMVERIEILRGPASLLYGSNAMGGVINIVTRQKKEEGVITNVELSGGSFGTFQAEVGNQARVGKFSSSVALNYGRSNNHRENMDFEQYGGFVKFGYDFSDHWSGYINADIIHFYAENPGEISNPLFEGQQWITRGVAELAVSNNYGWTNGSISVYDNFGFHKINDGYRAGANPQENLFRSSDALIGLSVYQTFEFFRGNHLTFGIDYQHIYGNAYYTSRATGEQVQHRTPNSSALSHRDEVAGYFDFRQDVVDWFSLDAGLRLDWHSVAGLEWIPQAGLVFRPLHDAEIKAMVSKGFRNPTMREMYLYPPANDSLRAERVWNYELSWRQHLRKQGINYGINVFYLHGDNQIQTVPVNGTPRNINTGEVQNAGIEMDFDYRISDHWAVSTNHNYLYMRYPVLAAPQYKGYLGGRMNYEKWHASVGLQYVHGLYTQTDVTENFWQLNATVSYLPVKQVEIWLRGDNLLNQEYEINAGFPMPRINCMAGIRVNW